MADPDPTESAGEPAALRRRIRLWTLGFIVVAGFAANLASDTDKPSFFVWLMAVAASAAIGCFRPFLSGAVVLIAAAAEWLAWMHGPGLSPLPVAFASALAPALVLGAANLWRPPALTTLTDRSNDAGFFRALALGVPLCLVWVFGMMKTFAL